MSLNPVRAKLLALDAPLESYPWKEELGAAGWQESDLQARAKRNVTKLRIARRLRTETTMSLKWIAQRLHMGTWTYVSNLLASHEQSSGEQVMLPLCQK
jgi:hypothetical protein